MIRKKIRKIVFGIRFKISVVMIIAILFVSALIGLAVYMQHVKKIEDAMLRFGSTILKGADSLVQTYLLNLNLLDNNKEANLSNEQKRSLIVKQKEVLKELAEYFSSIIKKERMLDFTYLIDTKWKDINVDWKRWDQSKYYYFDRNYGRIYPLGKGRRNPFLEPTILSHYMNNIDTNAHLTYTDLMDEEKFKAVFKKIKRNYVVIGIPIFNNTSDKEAYENYNKFKGEEAAQGKKLKSYYKRKEWFYNTFLQRAVNYGINLDYTIQLENDKNKKLIYYYFTSLYDISGFDNARKKELSDVIVSKINEKINNNKISISNLESIYKSIQSKYRIKYKPGITESKIGQNCFYYMKRNRISISTAHTIDELALFSYRKDLAGILGLFLDRRHFFAEMEKDRNELINLILTILLRAIFVSLFFPTFIVRSISNLAEGAMEIGKGNFDTRIEISGSDELGRLADILNAMTANLKAAQELKIEKVRMEKELITAQQIQSALLPEKLPKIHGIEFGTYYSAQSESGGDYYDFIDLGDNQIGITMADVSGHGVGSGLVMAMTRTLLHIYCKTVKSPKAILENINQYLKENTASNFFVTMFYGILDLGSMKLTFSSAGHQPGLVMRNNKIRELPAGGIALGATDNSMFSEYTDIKTTTFQKGDYFIQYTDGVDEAMDANNNEFGLERFYEALLAGNGKSAQAMIDNVVNEINKFTGKIPQHDDITMTIIKIT